MTRTHGQEKCWAHSTTIDALVREYQYDEDWLVRLFCSYLSHEGSTAEYLAEEVEGLRLENDALVDEANGWEEESNKTLELHDALQDRITYLEDVCEQHGIEIKHDD